MIIDYYSVGYEEIRDRVGASQDGENWPFTLIFGAAVREGEEQ